MDAREVALLRQRIAELEAMLASSHDMMQEVAKAAGFHIGEQYSAASIIARLRHQKTYVGP